MKQHPLLRWLVVAFLVAGVALVAPPVSAGGAATVTVHNGSDWDIYHLFMSPTHEDEWGPDQLGDRVLAAGGSFSISSVPCGAYDVRLIDEDGDECVVPAVDVCDGRENWVFDNDDLLDCEWGS
jgi:hypothetical protein